MAELDDFRPLIGIGRHSIATFTLDKRRGDWTTGNVCSSAIAIIFCDGLVPAEKVGNLIYGQYINILWTCCILRYIYESEVGERCSG